MMGFVDYIKNVFRVKKKEESDEFVDLKHANIESTDGSEVDLSDGDELSDEEAAAAARIEKEGSFQKASAKDTKTDTKTGAPAPKKVNLICSSCNYKFTRVEDNVPKMCPYCGKDL